MKDDGGSAFPLAPCGTGDPRDGMAGGSVGMSLLDYFAAASMPIVAIALKDTPKRDGITLGQHAAEIAYAIAARMLAERTRGARTSSAGSEG